jgi:hypothetical protein
LSTLTRWLSRIQDRKMDEPDRMVQEVREVLASERAHAYFEPETPWHESLLVLETIRSNTRWPDLH